MFFKLENQGTLKHIDSFLQKMATLPPHDEEPIRSYSAIMSEIKAMMTDGNPDDPLQSNQFEHDFKDRILSLFIGLPGDYPEGFFENIKRTQGNITITFYPDWFIEVYDPKIPNQVSYLIPFKKQKLH